MFLDGRVAFEIDSTATRSTCTGEIFGTIFAEANQGVGATADQSELAEGIFS